MHGERLTGNGSFSDQSRGLNKQQLTLMTMLVWMTIFSVSLVPTGIWQFDGILPSMLIFISLALIYCRAMGWLFSLWLCLLIGAILIPAYPSVRGPAKRTSCLNHLKQIQLALLNYHSAHGHFPPAYTVDADGKPLHSWRTLILPHLEENARYDQIDFSKPWNHPLNARLAAPIPDLYRCPSDEHLKPGNVTTSYIAVIGIETMWPPDGNYVQNTDITDGMANTISVIESTSNRIHWMSPGDIQYSQLLAMIQKGNASLISSQHNGGAQVALADGSCCFVAETLPSTMIQAALTINGSETVDFDP